MAQSYSFRIQAEGLEQFRAQMEAAARGNEALAAAWQRVQASSPQFASAMERAQQATDRQTQALQRHAAANDNAAASTGRMGGVLASAGFQVQDFAAQVSAGTSALTAFAQQAPQFLGAFGTGGAIAGAAVAVGAIAAQFLLTGENAAEAARRIEQNFEGVTKGQEDLAKAIRDVNALYLTQEQRARQAGDEARKALGSILTMSEGALTQRLEGNTVERGEALRAVQEQERRIEARLAQARLRGSNVYDELDRDRRELAFRQSVVSGIDMDTGRVSNRLGEVAAARARLANAPDYSGGPRDNWPAMEDAASAFYREQERGQRGQRGGGAAREERDREVEQFLDDIRKAEEEARTFRERERVEQARDLDRQAQRQEALIDRTASQYSSQIAQATVDGLMSGFDEGKSFWETFAQAGSRILRTVLVGGLDTLVIRPLIQPIVGGVMGGGSVLGALGGIAAGPEGATGGGGIMSSPLLNALGIGRSVSSLSGLGEGLGFGRIGGAISGLMNTPLYGGVSAGEQAFLAAAGVQNAGAVGAATLGDAVTGVGLGFASGSLISSLIAKTPAQRTNGTIGAGVGSLAGAGIGTLIAPGIGTIIGGLIGGSGGGLASLFGPSKAFSGGDAILGIDGSGNLVVTGYRGKNFSDSEALVEEAQKQAAIINGQLSSRGLRFQGSASAMAGFVGGGQSPNPKDALGAIQATGWAIPSLQASDPAVQRLLDARRGDNRSLDTVLSEVDWLKNVYEPLVKTVDATADFEKSLADVAAKYDEAINKAVFLGQETDKLTAARDREIDTIRRQRERQWQSISENINIRFSRAAGDNLGADLQSFDIAARAEREGLSETLRTLGADAETTAITLGNLEKLLAEERLAIQRQYASQSIGIAEAQGRGTADALARSAGDLFRQLTYGGLSGLAPETRYFAAVSDLRGLQRAGDIEGYIRAAPGALSVARDFLGTSEQFAALTAEVSRTVSTAAPGAANGLNAYLEAQVAGTDRLVEVTASYGAQQVDVLRNIEREIAGLRSQVLGLIARAA